MDTLIINATECEPYITADDALIREHAADIVLGAQIAGYTAGRPQKVIIGIEDNKPEAIKVLQQCIAGTAIELVSFATKYPPVAKTTDTDPHWERGPQWKISFRYRHPLFKQRDGFCDKTCRC